MLIIGTSLPIQKLPMVGLGDKVNHLLAYFGLALLLNLTLIYQRKFKPLFDKSTIVTILICLAYGVLDELHQIFIPGRSAETLDWLADSMGTFLGVFTLNYLINRLKYKPEFK